MKPLFIKEGAKGVYSFRSYAQYLGNDPKLTAERVIPCEVVKTRSSDFIVKINKDGKDQNMYCEYPKNSKDGSEKYWLTDGETGYVKHLISEGDAYRHLTEIVFQF